ncbi:MAG TPA: hypothetical protein VEJ45_08425 [Candidatus Acidoferrales bacterium]|nr:hypothetical protein [Candidatus Acidoferrales bacterium]
MLASDASSWGSGSSGRCAFLNGRTNTKLEDHDAIELNRDLHFNRQRLNPNGGAIALGQPIASTGNRILTTLLHELRQPSTLAGQTDSPRTGRRGLATLCVSGGLAMAVEIETV